MPVDWLSLALVAAMTLVVVLPGLLRAPSAGVVFGLAIVFMSTWLRPGGLEQLGLQPPASWTVTSLVALGSGAAITLLTIGGIEPLVERWTGVPHDWSVIEGVRTSWSMLLQVVVIVWIFVALIEELMFRGFLMLELKSLLGGSPIGLSVNLLISSAVFGLAHSYQGPSGVWSTGIVGALLGGMFVLGGFNLWLPILTHGFIDSFSLIMMRLGWDRILRGTVREKLA